MYLIVMFSNWSGGGCVGRGLFMKVGTYGTTGAGTLMTTLPRSPLATAVDS